MNNLDKMKEDVCKHINYLHLKYMQLLMSVLPQ